MATIGIIGPMGSGKTNLLGGICKEHKDWPGFLSIPFEIEDAVNAAMASHGWSSAVNFKINDIIHPQDKSHIGDIVARISSRPIDWPRSTKFSDTFPMLIDFESRDLQSGERAALTRKIELVDMPGGHFDPRFVDAQYVSDEAELARNCKAWEETRRRLSTCEALVICLDANTPRSDQNSIDNVTRTLEEILRVARDIHISAKGRGGKDLVFPVTIAFTKFDEIVANKSLDPEAEFNRLFDQFAIQAVSDRNQGIWIMGCPVSVVAPGEPRQRFLARNLHLPFLYSTMGIILTQAWKSSQYAQQQEGEAQRVREMKFGRWLWQFVRGNESRSATHKKNAAFGRVVAANEMAMAASIFGHLCLEEYIDGKVKTLTGAYPDAAPNLRFALNGKKGSLSAMRLPAVSS